MLKRKVFWGVLASLLFFLIAWPGQAQASEMLTRLGGSPAVVGQGQKVDTVVAIGTDARVAGVVKDIVLVINGNVTLAPSARVDLVIALGGHVANFSSERVRSGVFEVSPTPELVQDLLLGGLLLLGTWIARIMASLLGVFLLTGLGYALCKRFNRASAFLANAPGRLFAIGVAGGLVSFALTVLLSVTIIGIPVAVFVLLLTVLAAFLGILPLLDYLGREFLNAKVQDYPPITRWLILAGLFVALVNVPLLGFFFLLCVGAVGLGLSILLTWGSLRRKR